MHKHIVLISGIILSVFCHAQEDSYGINLGLEIFGFDQAKVTTEYLPELFPDNVIQINYLLQISYAFPGKSEVGMYLGYGQRKMDITPDAMQKEEIKTISALGGIFYKYKFIELNRFGIYCQSGLQMQFNNQQYKRITTRYDDYVIRNVLQQELEIYSLDVNLRLGLEYRIWRGMYLNVFLGNDIISYNRVPQQFSTTAYNILPDDIIMFVSDPSQNENAVYSTEPISRWTFVKNHIILGGGLKYQF